MLDKCRKERESLIDDPPGSQQLMVVMMCTKPSLPQIQVS